MKKLIRKVEEWHEARNLIEGSDDKTQALKLLQELGELSDTICKKDDPRVCPTSHMFAISDDIGDMLVVMINICMRNSISLSECLECAYEDIKDRKGRMVDGVFIKDE